MRRTALTASAALALLAGVSSPSTAADSVAALRSAFVAHCIECHGKGDTVEGEVNLLALKTGVDLQSRPELLEDLIGVLRDREMPPKDEPALSQEQRKHMIGNLQSVLREGLKTYPFERTPIRRMNRFQYNNAVVDLLELDRDILQLNERLLRRRDDYFRPETGKMPARVRVSSRPLSKDIDNQRPEGFRGVAAFPQDQRAENGFDNRADHLTLSPLLMESFLTLSQTIVESPDLNARECRSWGRLFAAPGTPTQSGRYEAEGDTRLKVNGRPKGRAAPQNMQGAGDDWSGDAHLFWQCPKVGVELTLSIDVKKAGDGLRLAFTKARDYGRFEVYLDDKMIGSTVDLYNPKPLHVEQSVAGKISQGLHALKFKCVGKNEGSTGHFFGLDYVDVTGGENDPQPGRQIAEAGAIRGRLQRLLRRAFRRPVDPETLNRFTRFAESQLASGVSYEETMRTIVGAVLAMPDFLYFYDGSGASGKGDGRAPVDDYELASRLAQFFWSSIPDDALLDLAESGDLSDPKVLGKQIDRMLNDRRSSRFCDNFPGQWLQLDRLVTSIPDREKFPYFYYHGYRTSMHMMSEPLLLFETVFVEDLSVMDLIDPKFTWQSNMLRQNYEGQSKSGHEVQVQVFARVAVEDSRRGGVITNAAVMTMTSTPTRTQPITRGAWLNTVIFNDPPEAPPADVPGLPEIDKEALAKLTIRERLAVHRQRADCAGCHNRIDPLGFALENYGPTGVWRDKYENGRDVDASGVLFNQHEFKTVVDFKRLIVQEKQRFIRGFVSHLLSYALGRELGPADWPALDEMTAQAMAGDDQLRAVLKSIAMSDPFLYKNTADPVVANKAKQ